MGMVRPDLLLREPISDAPLQLDGCLYPLADVQVESPRCAARGKGAHAAERDSERGDRNVSGHQLHDRRAARFVNFADEHQRQVYLLRLDEPQPSGLPAECLNDAPLLGGDRSPRRIGQLDGGEQPH